MTNLNQEVHNGLETNSWGSVTKEGEGGEIADEGKKESVF
jgi:hypothetical protein